MEDLAHHVIFVGVFAVVNFAFDWGPIVNVLFFNRVPGGINYVLLVLRRSEPFRQCGRRSSTDPSMCGSECQDWYASAA